MPKDFQDFTGFTVKRTGEVLAAAGVHEIEGMNGLLGLPGTAENYREFGEPDPG